MALAETASSAPEAAQLETIHCGRCNSDVARKNVLRLSWTGEKVPTCPNCGGRFVDAVEQGVPFGFAPAPGELRTCPRCGGIYEPLTVDARTGERRPTRFCHRCGHPVGP
jgi:ribosomal protein S27AE